MKDPKPAGVAPEDDIEMGFFEHLIELRTRLVRALYGIVPACLFAWNYHDQLMDLILSPLKKAYDLADRPNPAINFANPVDPFVAHMQVAVIAGLILATPWIFYQVWAFIAPGLYRRERLLAIPFVFFSTIFFAGGAIFGFEIVFPFGLETFLSFAGQLPSGMTMEPEIMIDEYLTFATRMLLAFGVVFEVPVVVTFLALANIVTWRQLLSFSRWWIVISSVVSAVLTPPDVASQLMMMAPLIILYMLSVLIAWFVQSVLGRGKPDPVSDVEDTTDD